MQLYHVGVLAFDIEGAVARHREVLGSDFSEVRAWDLAEGGTVRLAFSRQGPPYVELIEATGDGIYAAAQGEGLHHLGYWVDDVAAATARLEASGLTRELEVAAPDGGLLLAYFAPAGLRGVRTEVVAASAKPVLEEWLKA